MNSYSLLHFVRGTASTELARPVLKGCYFAWIWSISTKRELCTPEDCNFIEVYEPEVPKACVFKRDSLSSSTIPVSLPLSLTFYNQSCDGLIMARIMYFVCMESFSIPGVGEQITGGGGGGGDWSRPCIKKVCTMCTGQGVNAWPIPYRRQCNSDWD